MRRPLAHPRPADRRRAFTLLELILVLLILSIASAIVVPSMMGFATGRANQNAATLVLGLANQARSQASAKGTVCRINFDAGAGQVWLTEQRDGSFQPPTEGDTGKRFAVPDGVRMSVDVTPGVVAVPGRLQSPDVQQSAVPPAVPFGQELSTPNTLVQVPHGDGGTYVEIQPGGRTDPCVVRLTGADGTVITIGCATATDVLHVLKPGEM